MFTAYHKETRARTALTVPRSPLLSSFALFGVYNLLILSHTLLLLTLSETFHIQDLKPNSNIKTTPSQWFLLFYVVLQRDLSLAPSRMTIQSRMNILPFMSHAVYAILLQWDLSLAQSLETLICQGRS